MCRLARIHSICMKFMAYPLPLLQFTQLHPMPLRSPIPIHLLSRFPPRTNHRPSASYVSARHARSYFYHVVTSSRAKSAPSTWSNLALVEPSLMQRSLLRLPRPSPRRLQKRPLPTAPRLQLLRRALPGKRRLFQRLRQGMMVQLTLLTHQPLTYLRHLRSLLAIALQKRHPHRHQRTPQRQRRPPQMYPLLRQFLRTHGASAVRRAGSVPFAVNVSFFPFPFRTYRITLFSPSLDPSRLPCSSSDLLTPPSSVHLPPTDHDRSTDDGGL